MAGPALVGLEFLGDWNMQSLGDLFDRIHSTMPGDAPGSFLLRLAVALRDEDVKVHVVAPAADGVPTEGEIDGITVERFRYAPRKYEKLAYTGNMAQDVATSWSARLALVGFFGSDFVRALRCRASA